MTAFTVAKSYYQRPCLAWFRHGYVVGDWSRPDGAPRFAEGIDLLNSPFQLVGDSNDARRLAFESGIVDTALERLTVRPHRSFNTLPLFAAASAQGVSIRTLAAGQQPVLDDVAVPSPIHNVFGFVHTYAHYGRGLIIYSGFDHDMTDSDGSKDRRHSAPIIVPLLHFRPRNPRNCC
jgi:hypothetical protein